MGKHKRILSSSSSSESNRRKSRSSSSRSSSSSSSRNNRKKKYSRDDQKKNGHRKDRRRDRSRSKSRSRSNKRRHERKERNEDRKPRRERSKGRDRSVDKEGTEKRPERNERNSRRPQNGREDKKRRQDEENNGDQNIPEDYRDDRNAQRQNEEPKPGEEEKIEVEKPNFEPSGILAKFSNTINGVTLKFTEPPDAKRPNVAWKVFPFRADEEFPVIPIFKQSCYLFGKDTRVADILIEHPTCSGQHAVIQFREIPKQDQSGEFYTVIKPYLLDLESTNGTFLNGNQIEPARYYELLHSDVVKFGKSTRDYVIMREDTEVQNESDND